MSFRFPVVKTQTSAVWSICRIYVYIYTSSSSSSSSFCAACTDFPDSLVIRPYHHLLLAGLLDNILRQNRAVRTLVLIGRPTLLHFCKGVYRRTSFMSSSLLLQQCPACLIHFIWVVLEIGSRWPYRSCFVGCCFQD